MGKRLQTHVGGKYDMNLVMKFKDLAQASGVSMYEALRRVMIQAILVGKVPGIDVLDLERRDHEKYGAATPIYDGEQTTQTQRNREGKVTPALPSE